MQSITNSITSSFHFALGEIQATAEWLGKTIAAYTESWLMPTITQITNLFDQTIDNSPQAQAPISENRAIRHLDDAIGNHRLPLGLLQMILDYTPYDIIEWIESDPKILEQKNVESKVLSILQEDMQNLPVKAILALAKCPQSERYKVLVTKMLLRNERNDAPDFQLPDLCKLHRECPYKSQEWNAYMRRQFANFNLTGFKQQSASELIESYAYLSSLSDLDCAHSFQTSRQAEFEIIESALLANGNQKFRSLNCEELGKLAQISGKNGYHNPTLATALHQTLENTNFRLFDEKSLIAFFLYPYPPEVATTAMFKEIQGELARGCGGKLHSCDGNIICELVEKSISCGILIKGSEFKRGLQIELLKDNAAKLRSCTAAQRTKLTFVFEARMLFESIIRSFHVL